MAEAVAVAVVGIMGIRKAVVAAALVVAVGIVAMLAAVNVARKAAGDGGADETSRMLARQRFWRWR